MYITPGLDPPNFNTKTSNSCGQTESKFIWSEMAADILTEMFMSGFSKGMCLYIDVFRSVTYEPMYKTLYRLFMCLSLLKV